MPTSQASSASHVSYRRQTSVCVSGLGKGYTSEDRRVTKLCIYLVGEHGKNQADLRDKHVKDASY